MKSRKSKKNRRIPKNKKRHGKPRKTKVRNHPIRSAKTARVQTTKRHKKPGAKSKKLQPRKIKKPKSRRITDKAVKKRTVKPAVARKPAYLLNTGFGSFYELRDLILKSLPAEKNGMAERINKLGKVKLAVVSGIFINKDNLDPLVADLLIVGDYIDSRKLRSFLKSLEAEVGKEIKYSIMDKDEFQYRLAMFDRFIRVLLEGPHEKLINKLGV